MRPLPAADPGSPWLDSPFHFLWWLARAQWQTLASGAFVGALGMGATAALPVPLGLAVEAAVRRQPGPLLAWSLGILVLGGAGAGFGILRHRRAVYNYLRAATRVQQLLIRHSVAMGAELSEQVTAGEVASLGAADVERIGNAYDVTARFSAAVVTYIGVTVVLFFYGTGFGLVASIGGPLTVVAFLGCLVPLRRRQTAQREELAGASALAVDVVGGLRILRGLGGEAVFSGRFLSAVRRVQAAMVATARVEAVLSALEVMVPGAFLVAVTWIGAGMAQAGNATPGQLVTAYGFAAFLLLPLSTFGEGIHRFSAALVAASRVVAVLRRQRTLPEVARDRARPLRPGLLIDSETGVAIRPGVITGVASANPEELTRLAERLGRYRDPAPEQEVTLAGVPLRVLSLDDVRRHVLVLDRDARLLAGPLRAQLTPPAAASAAPSIERVIKAAAASDVIESLPEGIEYRLPERGRSLSGGQRQRMLLATALRASPAVLILEEPTGAVDTHTEALIAERVSRLRKGRATVLLTTSPLLLERAEEVYFLEQRVVARGSHEELMAASPAYRGLIERELGQP